MESPNWSVLPWSSPKRAAIVEVVIKGGRGAVGSKTDCQGEANKPS
jgi:hypothetical protein